MQNGWFRNEGAKVTSSTIPKELPREEQLLLRSIQKQTDNQNKDNITRTKAYEAFFAMHPTVHWSYLAGMVSRNAGWNMCDLASKNYGILLTPSYRKLLFLTYEQANWLIFRDAYPQLLLFHYSTKWNRPLFHLCKYFYISSFIEAEWNYFWRVHDEKRLVYSMIVNEQHIIDLPVIKKGPYNTVFHSFHFFFQDMLHFSTVLFPNRYGEWYGSSVANFRTLDNRIELGKKLYAILFSDLLHSEFLAFSRKTEHTGSRHDYQRFSPILFSETPYLRSIYPVVTHYMDESIQWNRSVLVKSKWYDPPEFHETINLTKWYQKKQKQLQVFAAIKAALP